MPLSPETTKIFQGVIRELHGCESSYVESVPVHETFQGQPVWDGIVHVFDLEGHPTAPRAYVWSELLDDWSGNQSIKAVLHQGPVVSPLDAVRANIVHSYKKQEGETDA
jgi:hypothetical protein